MRKADEHPKQPLAQILQSKASGLSDDVLSQLPERKNLKQAIRRQRRQDLPPNPRNLDELEDIPARFTKTLIGDPFLLHDTKNDYEVRRFLVFETTQNIELLYRSCTWFIDGTFKVLVHFSIFFCFINSIFTCYSSYGWPELRTWLL